MEVEAKARYMRIAPRKARLVANTVIGMPAKDALVVLQFTPQAAAKEVAKVVKSAMANASNNFSQDEDELIVKSIIVNEGPTLKRGRARARGMYFSIFKRTSHITAVVDTETMEGTSRRLRAAAKAEAAAPAKEKAEKPTRAEKAAKPARAEKPAKADRAVDEPSAEEPEVVEAAEAARAEEAETEAVEAGTTADGAVAEEPVAESTESAEPVAEQSESDKPESDKPESDKSVAEKPAEEADAEKEPEK
jgi:large subunit ribosomal protein L22